jgi:AcrR family transcriptional regulator
MDGKRRRQVILEAALRRFAWSGYTDATMAGIAKDSGISPPMLYRYYPVKRELFLEALRHAEAVWQQHHLAELENLAFSEAYREIPEPMVYAIRVRHQALAGEVDPAVQAEVRENFARFLVRVRDAIAAAQKSGRIKRTLPVEQGTWIFAALCCLIDYDLMANHTYTDDRAYLIARAHTELFANQ